MNIYDYENLKILKRMKSKTILFLYLFYIIFAQWVFINKVGFDILLISASLTFLFTFAMGSMLQNEIKNKNFFIELKQLYKKYDKTYEKIDVSHINNKLENEETILANTFFTFSIFVGVAIGVGLSFSYGQKILPFFSENIILAISIVFLIFVFLTLFENLKEELEYIREKQKGISGFFKHIFLYGIIRPLFIAVEFIGALIISGLGIILGIIIICFILSIIFGGVGKMFTLIFVIIGNILTVGIFGIIGGVITFLIFYIMGFGTERFSKKDIHFLNQGLDYEMENLKRKYDISESSFAVNDTIKYILLFTIPFVAAYLWSYLSTDIGFSILSYIKPIEIKTINILGMIPNWEMVTSAKGFGNTISSFFGFVILFIIGVIAIPFRTVTWVIQAIAVIVVSVFNSLIGVILLVSFLFPVLYASWIKFKENKSLSNFTAIYIYLSFIIILFFLSLL